MNKLSSISLIIILLVFTTSTLIAENRPLMRFPDVYENTIVFTYGEDIWSVSADGGIASRLTIHDGEERFPKFSPDGNLIAFTGEYDGNSDVYVMNVNGGNIKRLTFHPDFDEVVGWHPLKNKIIFRSHRQSFSDFYHLFLISPDGTDLEKLILHEAAQGSFSADGKKIAYNRESRENRTWKRYQGGTAQEIYLYDFETQEDRNLTNFKGTDRIPMWIGNKIYFSSDRDRILNIYSYDLSTSGISQITFHKEYDIRRPSMGIDKIVYELGGTLWLLDVNTNKTKQISVQIKADAAEVRPYLKKVDKLITGFDCSPSGKRALITARGEVFTVPIKNGAIRNLTMDSGARDKNAAWSPDGKTIAYLSDKAGEYDLYLIDQYGKKETVRLTHYKDGYRHTIRWSPDSKKIAFADQTLRCYYIDVNTKEITEVDKAYYENTDVSLDVKPIYDFSWSPDSRFIAYSKMDEDLVNKVYIYSLETGKIHCVSNGLFNDFNPIFTKDGEYLLFISNRCFDPTFCDFEWEMVYKKVAGIYCLTLKKDGKPFLPFKSDEEDKVENEDKESDNKKDEKKVKLVIDFNGLAERIEALPLERGNYRSLAANEKAVFYLNADEGDYNRFEFRKKGAQTLYSFSIKDRKEQTVIEDINSYKLSTDGASIVYKKNDNIGIIKAEAENSKGKSVNLNELKMWINPMAEWQQIFNEAWRMERDFYYEPNLQGLDWDTMKVKYGRLIPFASCRQDISFIIGELIGELNTSHTYVSGGDRQRKAESVNVGMLGVDWEIDNKSNCYRFKKIYRVPDWSRKVFPPLARPGINVKEGDYILQINGNKVTADKNIYSYFTNLANKQVTLLVNNAPKLEGATEITVKPVSSETTLRYLDWVEHNRLLVNKKSNGQIGYLHLPDTFTDSAIEFPKYFYSQLRKKGIIVDGRFNGGGLDGDIFLRRLDKDILTYWTRRYSHDQTSPQMATRAHLVYLTNRQAGSGGDEMPYNFQQKGMGPVIGMRTWGGLVGMSTDIGMIDGGELSAPDYRIYSSKGKWVVENEGVTPDIIVDLDPAELARGYDAQLEKGIEVLLKKIAQDPRPWPEHEAFPVDK